MLLQRGRHNERHITVAALEYILARLPVGLHVSRQLAALGTGVRAKLTLVRLLSRMGSPVHGEVAAVLEHLAAVLARIVLSPPDQLLARLGIKEGIDPALLDQDLDGAGLHLAGQLKPAGQQRQLSQ